GNSLPRGCRATRHCCRSIPMWIVYRTPRYSIKLVWTKTASKTTTSAVKHPHGRKPAESGGWFMPHVKLRKLQRKCTIDHHGFIMAAFIYRCPVVGYDVQAFVADDPTTSAEDAFQSTLIALAAKFIW